ncbi:prepilin peptidase [Enterovibrio sp. 27052020O]|uniref:A24 family peptidase n=1 Tax=Enterovibrio sp. 27052020O TaxID=3241166 RepID=UPI00388FA862
MSVLELLLISGSIAGMATDIYHRKISNRLCLSIFLLCLLLAFFDEKIQLHVYQSLSVVVIGLVLFSVGILGAGDTKLLAAYALIIDQGYFSLTLLMIGLLGGFTAIIIFLMQLISKNTTKKGVPYGVPIVISSLFSLYLSKLN